MTTDGVDWLFFADSESSSVRKVSLKDGAVSNVAGGDRDPLNLFSYGDSDGDGIAAKLQHPLGVSYDTANNILYIADSYNHKVKKAVLNGKLFSVSHVQDGLSEPGGLCVDASTNTIFIADTNNHSIKTLSLDNNTLETFSISAGDDVDSPDKNETDEVSELDVDASGDIIITADLDLKPGEGLNSEAESSWILTCGTCPELDTRGHVTRDGVSLTLSGDCLRSQTMVRCQLKCRLYLCSDKGVCTVRNVQRGLILNIKNNSGARSSQLKPLLV